MSEPRQRWVVVANLGGGEFQLLEQFETAAEAVAFDAGVTRTASHYTSFDAVAGLPQPSYLLVRNEWEIDPEDGHWYRWDGVRWKGGGS